MNTTNKQNRIAAQVAKIRTLADQMGRSVVRASALPGGTMDGQSEQFHFDALLRNLEFAVCELKKMNQ